MWCPRCQDDVAAQVNGDEAGVHCAVCGGVIAETVRGAAVPETKKARDLLERWAGERLLDPYGPLPQLAAGADRKPAEDAVPESDRDSRSDSPPILHQAGEDVRAPAETTASSPAIDVPWAIESHFRRSSSWMVFWGQCLAYAGVLGLTVGTVLVLWGYFGGRAGYLPTGWLTAAAGQMLLLLGVVTLVSGGMEQTAREVARRIDRLGERLVRIEQAARSAAPPPRRTDDRSRPSDPCRTDLRIRSTPKSA